MKPDIHPEYRLVLFRDTAADFEFLTRSSVQTDETAEFQGKEYPLVRLEISSESHPFYTGTQKLLDTAGRVERFYRKYGFAYEEEEAETSGDEPEAAPE